MSKAKPYKASDLVALIRSKYGGNGAYCVLEQVANGTGRNCDSWIDAAVFSLWPSNGIWRAACEVKVSRADFLKELSQPNKNEWARQHFDYFWYVVAPGVAKDDEIPSGCGLLTVRGGGLAVTKQAPRREDVKTDNTLIASFARSLDNERQRFLKEALREAINKDYDVRQAKLFKEGCERYFRECDTHCYPKSADEVYDKLRALVLKDAPHAAEAEHVQRCMGAFQEKVTDFLLAIAPLAVTALNARDDLGHFLVNAYLWRDEHAMDALKATLKKRKSERSQREKAEKIVGVRNALNESGAGE